MACGVSSATAGAVDVVVVTTEGPLQPVVDGQVGGVVADVVRATLTRAKLSYRMEAVPWARAYRQALADPGTLIFSLTRTPEREALFKWIGPIVPVRHSLYRRKGRTDVVVNSLDDARRYRIGVMRSDVPTEYLLRKGFPEDPHAGLQIVTKVETSYAQLLLDRVDLMPLRPEMCLSKTIDCARMEPIYHLSDLDSALYMAFSARTPETLVDRVRAALESMRRDGELARLTAPFDAESGSTR